MTITTLIIKIKLKLKFNDINDLINSIKGNTISEADTKKKINELNEIKKVEIKGKRLIESKKKIIIILKMKGKVTIKVTIKVIMKIKMTA